MCKEIQASAEGPCSDGDDLLLMDLARVHKNPFFCRKMLMLMMVLMMTSSMMLMMTSSSSLQQCIESLPVALWEICCDIEDKSRLRLGPAYHNSDGTYFWTQVTKTLHIVTKFNAMNHHVVTLQLFLVGDWRVSSKTPHLKNNKRHDCRYWRNSLRFVLNNGEREQSNCSS